MKFVGFLFPRYRLILWLPGSFKKGEFQQKKSQNWHEGIRKVQIYMESEFPPCCKKHEYEKKTLFQSYGSTLQKLPWIFWPLPFKGHPPISSRTRCFWDVARWPAFWVTRWVPSLLRLRREGLLRVGWFSCISDQGEFIKREFPKVEKKRWKQSEIPR